GRPRRAEDLRRKVVKRVLVTDGLQAVGVDALAKQGLEVDVVETLPEPALVARIGEYEGLIVRSATKVTRVVLVAGAKLEVVGRAGAGVDTIDVDAATERGVVVMNTPGGNTTAVAEHTLALLLALARRVPAADAALKAGRPDHQLRPGWHRGRAGARRRDPGRARRGSGARRLRARATAPRPPAARARAGDRDAAPRCRDRRGPDGRGARDRRAGGRCAPAPARRQRRPPADDPRRHAPHPRATARA